MAGQAPITSKPKHEPEDESVEDQIRRRAHEIYLSRSGADGSDLDDWLAAEAEIREVRNSDS